MVDTNALNKISYGLFVLTAKKDGKNNGCIINAAQQVTVSPDFITIAVNKQNYTHDIIAETGMFNVSTLTEDVSFDLFKHFGFQSGKTVDKFKDFNGYAEAENGIAYINEGANAYVSAMVTRTVDLGSHTLFVAKVTDAVVLSDRPSVTYAYYHANVKPKPVPKISEKSSWRCKICGYVYEGESLPEDFVCPWCKHPASDFIKE